MSADFRGTCPACKRMLAAPAALAGRQASCPFCKAVIDLPATPPAPEQSSFRPSLCTVLFTISLLLTVGSVFAAGLAIFNQPAPDAADAATFESPARVGGDGDGFGGSNSGNGASPARVGGEGGGFGGSNSGNGAVNVRGYYRKDGTYVAPHTRSSPGTGSRGGRR
jgi:hypothetical protein